MGNLLEMAEFARSEGARDHVNPILVYGFLCLTIHVILWYGAKSSKNNFLVVWLLFSLIEIMVCLILIVTSAYYIISTNDNEKLLKPMIANKNEETIRRFIV